MNCGNRRSDERIFSEGFRLQRKMHQPACKSKFENSLIVWDKSIILFLHIFWRKQPFVETELKLHIFCMENDYNPPFTCHHISLFFNLLPPFPTQFFTRRLLHFPWEPPPGLGGIFFQLHEGKSSQPCHSSFCGSLQKAIKIEVCQHVSGSC